jgi:hypothetical protein
MMYRVSQKSFFTLLDSSGTSVRQQLSHVFVNKTRHIAASLQAHGGPFLTSIVTSVGMRNVWIFWIFFPLGPRQLSLLLFLASAFFFHLPTFHFYFYFCFVSPFPFIFYQFLPPFLFLLFHKGSLSACSVLLGHLSCLHAGLVLRCYIPSLQFQCYLLGHCSSHLISFLF